MHFYWATLTLLLLFNLCESQVTEPFIGWTQPPSLMPYVASTLFIGYQPSTDRIWLIGSANEYIMSYTIGINQFHYWPTFTNQINLYNEGMNAQISAQWGDDDIMFMHYGILYSFSFNSHFITTYQAVTYNREAPCVAVLYPNYVFAIGGVIVSSTDPENAPPDESKYVQIYNYGQSTWSNGPNMDWGRTKHACVIHNNYLYVFGGSYYHTTNQVWGIRPYSEKLYVGNMPNINSFSWQNIAYKSNSNVYYHRAVVHSLYNQIYLVGGRNSYAGYASKGVQIYDITNNIIELDNDNGSLNTGRSSAAAIIVNDILYIFGGNNGGDLNSWEKTNILTFSPTKSPTNIPTITPTKFPTYIPTITPTKSPTNIPTISPTNMPSKFPTNVPSVSPSKSPTSITIIPTYIPSMEPTYIPTEYPTMSPSNTPTQSPETGLQVVEPTINGYTNTIVNTKEETTKINTIDENGSNIIINDKDENIASDTLFYIILIIILILFVICMFLAFYIVYRNRKQNKILDNTKSIEMTEPHINKNITMSANSSDNNVIDSMNKTTNNTLGGGGGGIDMQRVTSVSTGIDTPFGDLGDLLDDNNNIYNENSGLQNVISMSSHPSQNNSGNNIEQYDEDDDMYDKGNNNYNIELQTQGNTNNGLIDDNFDDLSDEGTNSELSDKSDDDSIDGNGDTINTTQGQLTTVS